MKTFYELGTMPKVGDLITKLNGNGWDNPVVFMVTKIIGENYHVHNGNRTLHRKHLATYYAPLGQEPQ